MKKNTFKKIIPIMLAACFLCFIFSGCSPIDAEKLDKCAVDYLTGLLNNDKELIKTTLHPDYQEKAMPDDEFYQNIQKIGILKGSPFNGLNSENKRYSDDTELDGRVIICDFTADINYIFYSVEITVLDNKKGFGIIGCAIDFCTDEKYFQNKE